MEGRFRIEQFDRPLDIAWVLKATGGKLHSTVTSSARVNPQLKWTAITTDSRLVSKGDLFVPLHGEASDGHAYIQSAFERGAAAVLCNQSSVFLKTILVAPNTVTNLILVPDTLRSLGDLAHAWRQDFSGPIVAITGSNGKTTTKEFVLAILKRCGSPLGTWKNWNNLIGMPLTLLQLRRHHTHAVLEMGMNQFGEIRRMAEIANPTHRLITNIMPVHLEGVGDIEGVARAKGELVEDISTEQTFVVHVDDPRIVALAKNLNCKKITYSTVTQSPASLHQNESDVQLHSLESLGTNGFRGQISVASKTHYFEFSLSGMHNLHNMLAAVAIGYSLGVPTNTILEAVSTAHSAEMRSEWVPLNNGMLIYNDCYNANPGSMRAALDTIKLCHDKQPVAVLGDMLELGDAVESAHQEILRYAAELEFKMVFCLGPQFHDAAQRVQLGNRIQAFEELEALYQELAAQLHPNDVILVKGSRGMQMERVTAQLQKLFPPKET
jgi:UDP-N-acetylmuramoyl-tripeptide--D-alanyl-D-alanine ligase